MLSQDLIANMSAVLKPALALAPRTFISEISADLSVHGIPSAVRHRDTKPIYNWLIFLSQLQDISDQIASSYAERHGLVRWSDVIAELACSPSCRLLRSYWDFSGCGYSKSARTCSQPSHFTNCPLPTHPLRKGSLNQCAYSLYLFIRDVCDGDLVAWIDHRFGKADPGPERRDRAQLMRDAILEPLSHIHGVSNKILFGAR
jgi:hypothetical protein